MPLTCCVPYTTGKTSLPAPCTYGILMAGRVKLSVLYLALDAPASGVFNCDDGASPAYEVDAFVGDVVVGGGGGGGGGGAGFVIRHTVVRVTVENGTAGGAGAAGGAGSVGAWAANVSGVAEVSAGSGADGMPGLDMSVTFDAVLTGDGLDANTTALELAMQVTGEFTIGNDDFEVYGSINFEYPCTSGWVYATAGLELNNTSSSAMRVDAAEVLVAVACDRSSLPEAGRGERSLPTPAYACPCLPIPTYACLCQPAPRLSPAIFEPTWFSFK